MIWVRNLEGKGRGVFALKHFAKGELIERAPVLVIPAWQRKYLDQTILYNYYFAWGENPEQEAIAMGLGSFYNHSYTPNAIYIKKLEDLVVEYIALRDIEAGEEITINYNGYPDDKSPVWFEAVA